MFVSFDCSPDGFIAFMRRCAETGAESRFEAFLKAWEACAVLRGDVAAWSDALLDVKFHEKDDGFELIDRWIRDTKNGIADRRYRFVSPDAVSAHTISLWRDMEKYMDAMSGSCCIMKPPGTRVKVTDLLSLAARTCQTVRLIDRYAFTANRTPLRQLVRFLTNCGVSSVQFAVAYGDGRDGSNLLSREAIKTVAERIREKNPKSPLMEIFPHPFEELRAIAHDRFLAFSDPRSIRTGFAVQLGPGIGSFSDKRHPITISRVPVETFAEVWKSLPAVKPIEV